MMKTVCFVNQDLNYSWWLRLEINNSYQVQELVNDFKQEVEVHDSWNHSPEYFELFLEEKNINYDNVDSQQVGLVYWGE